MRLNRFSSPARVVFTINSLALSGGLERVLTTRCNYLGNDPELELHIVTLDAPDIEPNFELDKSVSLHRLNLTLSNGKSLLSFKNLNKASAYYRELSALLSDIDPDVVVNCDYNYSTFLLPFLVNEAKLFHEHHTTNAGFQKAGLAWMIKDSLRKAAERRYDKRIFLSEVEAKLSGFSDTDVIANPVAPRRAFLGADLRRSKIVLSAGRISAEKGYDRLIEIFAKVAPNFPAWRLLIHGDGDEKLRDKLILQAENSGFGDRISILCGTADLDDVMRHASVYAMTSRVETFPMVLLEAMREELPTIAFDCPTGPALILENGSVGVLVPDGDLDAFANQLSTLLESEHTRCSIANSARARVSRYSLDQIGAQWKSWFFEARSSRRQLANV